MRQQLSLALLAVISQQLVPTADGGQRYPAVEILVATPATRNLIRRGDDLTSFGPTLRPGALTALMTMEQSLAELVWAGRISRETASAHCYHLEDLRRHIDT